jgi:hypothetical protein
MLLALVGMTGLLALAPAVAHAAGVSLYQCRWGFGTAAHACIADINPHGWWSGGASPPQGGYREGDFVPTRIVIDNHTGPPLTANNEYSLIIEYDATDSSGFHTYDYLGNYNSSPRPENAPILPCSLAHPSRVPTAGPHACGSMSLRGPFGRPSVAPIPLDRYSFNARNNNPPTGFHFSAWGATLVREGPSAPHFVDCPGSSLRTESVTMATTGSVRRCIAIDFVANGQGVVIAWGAHIAKVADWGERARAPRGSGNDFHQRIERGGAHDFAFGAKTVSLGVIGALSGFTTSVSSPPSSSPPVIHPHGSVTERATLIGSRVYPAGTVRFYVCGPDETAPPRCATGGRQAGHPETVNNVLGTVRGYATLSPYPNEFAPAPPQGLASGFYCFRAVYIPAVNTTFPSLGAPWLETTHIETQTVFERTTECFQVAASTLIVEKVCTPPGNFNLHIRGETVDFEHTFTDVPCNVDGEVRVIGVPAGTYSVSESPGTGTNPADFDAPEFGSECANGSIMVPLDETKTCTIGNFRKGESRASLTVKRRASPPMTLVSSLC